MKYLKILSLAAVAVIAPMAIGVGSASATTLEVGGVAKNEAVEITASLESGTSLLLQLTNGAFANTCTESHVNGKTSVFTGTTVSGPLSTLTFNKCTNEKVVVDKAGSLSVERIGSTTNGTVRSSGAEVTVPSPIGTLNCKTGEGVDIGTLTGKASGQATLDIKAILNCGFLAPSAAWAGSYSITSPSGLGVTDTTTTSQTTLEVGGVAKNEAVEITASLESGTSLLLQLTNGAFANTCTESHVNGKIRQLSRPVEGMPQLTTIRHGPDDNSNDRQPACASWLTFGGGGGPVSMMTVVVPASRRWKPV